MSTIGTICAILLIFAASASVEAHLYGFATFCALSLLLGMANEIIRNTGRSPK